MKKNLLHWELNQGPSDPQPNTYPLSYKAIEIFYLKIDLYILPQTLDQYWLTLVILIESKYQTTLVWQILMKKVGRLKDMLKGLANH